MALAAAVVGVVLSILLVRVHAQAHAGIESFCTINELVNCDRVATSPYSVLFGIPVALWGVFGYALSAALALAALRSSAGSIAWSGLLLVVGAISVAASLVLAVISEVEIGALCLLCAGGWSSALVILESSRRACRDRGAIAAARDGFALLGASPGRSVMAAVFAVVAIAAAVSVYPRYWDRPKARPAPPRAGATVPASAGTSSTVIEYSDYECPFCARAHEDTRLLREKRPDITVVRRHFPLDSACNPLLKQPMHQSACTLARAAICAQDQGKFDEMDDALFRNQKDKKPVMDIARSLGLEPGRFQACVTAPETERRLQADIAAAMRDGVKGTPTYVIAGQVRSGEFPWELLPPPPAQGATTAPAR